MSRNSNVYTGMIKAKGWYVKDFLAHIGRTNRWYLDQCDGDHFKQLRLRMLIKGLDENEKI